MIKHFSRLLACLRGCYAGSRADFYTDLAQRLTGRRGLMIVTANPETLSQAAEHDDYLAILEDPRVELVADGIGLMKMAQTAGISIAERIPGVEIMQKLLDFADTGGHSVALFGAAAPVLTTLSEKLKLEKPGLRLVYKADGYATDKDLIMQEIAAVQPDLLFVALGIPLQEKLLHRHLDLFPHTIAVGVGGSFDVLSGTKKRAPAFFIRTNTEWLYRILREPKRLRRFWKNNIRFYQRWKKACRDAGLQSQT